MDVITGKPSPDVLDYLLKRRSVMVDNLQGPGPSPEQLQAMLTAAARVPDHGKMCPFYFVVFEGDARKDVGEIIADRFKTLNPGAREDKIEAERSRFMRAPLVVAIVSRMRKGKNPQWEQIMTAGAAAQNFSLAAHASGFAVQWLSEWYAYDDKVKAALGLDERDHIAGFMHVGTPGTQPEERDRPDLSKITSFWQKGAALNKGDADYDRDKFPYPPAGFAFKDGN